VRSINKVFYMLWLFLTYVCNFRDLDERMIVCSFLGAIYWRSAGAVLKE